MRTLTREGTSGVGVMTEFLDSLHTRECTIGRILVKKAMPDEVLDRALLDSNGVNDA